MYRGLLSKLFGLRGSVYLIRRFGTVRGRDEPCTTHNSNSKQLRMFPDDNRWQRKVHDLERCADVALLDENSERKSYIFDLNFPLTFPTNPFTPSNPLPTAVFTLSSTSSL